MRVFVLLSATGKKLKVGEIIHLLPHSNSMAWKRVASVLFDTVINLALFAVAIAVTIGVFAVLLPLLGKYGGGAGQAFGAGFAYMAPWSVGGFIATCLFAFSCIQHLRQSLSQSTLRSISRHFAIAFALFGAQYLLSSIIFSPHEPSSFLSACLLTALPTLC